MALQTYKTKRTGATKGHQLLKKKADALKARFQGIAKEIYATKATMADACGAAFFSLTAAQYAAGDFKNKVVEGSFEASCRIEGRTDNIAGVKIPVFRRVRAAARTNARHARARRRRYQNWRVPRAPARCSRSS